MQKRAKMVLRNRQVAAKRLKGKIVRENTTVSQVSAIDATQRRA